MESTKLEVCIRLMSTLLKHGPLSLNQIASFEDLDKNLLKKHITFLIEQGVAKKEEKWNYVITYAITDRGCRTLRFFQNPMLPQ